MTNCAAANDGLKPDATAPVRSGCPTSRRDVFHALWIWVNSEGATADAAWTPTATATSAAAPIRPARPAFSDQPPTSEPVSSALAGSAGRRKRENQEVSAHAARVTRAASRRNAQPAGGFLRMTD